MNYACEVSRGGVQRHTHQVRCTAAPPSEHSWPDSESNIDSGLQIDGSLKGSSISSTGPNGLQAKKKKVTDQFRVSLWGIQILSVTKKPVKRQDLRAHPKRYCSPPHNSWPAGNLADSTGLACQAVIRPGFTHMESCTNCQCWFMNMPTHECFKRKVSCSQQKWLGRPPVPQ